VGETVAVTDRPLIRPETAETLRGAAREVDAALGSFVAAMDELVDDLSGTDHHDGYTCTFCGSAHHRADACADDAAHASLKARQDSRMPPW
jgi:hypothetical protein